MTKGYIFDFDGTLIDSIPLWMELDINYLKKRGIACPMDVHSDIEGMSLWDCAEYFKKRFLIPDTHEEIMNEWREMMWESYLNTPLKNDAVEFILKTDKAVSIASSSEKALIERVIEKSPIKNKVQHIVTSDEVGKSKPDPAVFLETARKMGLDPQNIVVFEDTLAGVEGAKNASMQVVAVFEKNNHKWEQTKRIADSWIHSFDDWRED
ncbi:HAD family hydrolase [Guggenheimella bovis]